MQSDTPTPDHIAAVYMNTLSLKSDPASWWAHKEIERLRAEIAAAIKQRDEARREICRDEEASCSWHFTAEQEAERRGWDCFAQQEGGGA